MSRSPAALGFTVAFLDPSAGSIALYVAWVSFALSVIAIVISYDLNARQMKRTIQNIDSWERNPMGEPEPRDGVLRKHFWGKEREVLDTVNAWSVYLLIIGVIATMIHVGGTA